MMKWRPCLLALLTLVTATAGTNADTHRSTRVVDADQQAEETGWILVRYELITGTRHHLAMFVHQDLFDTAPQRPAPSRRD